MARLAELVNRHRLWLEVAAWALAAYGFATFAWYFGRESLETGGRAYDMRSYLIAARHLLEGAPLYAPSEINGPDAYRYLPTFAVAWVPVAALPELAVTWAYRAVCFLCLRYLVGSWRAVGVSLLFSPVGVELAALNVTLPTAAAARWALRGRNRGAGAAATTLAAVVKWGSALLLPYLWLRQPELRRPLLLAAGVLAIVLGLHVLLDPATWGAYLGSLRQQAGTPNGPGAGEQLIALVPNVVGDFLLRLALAGLMLLVAIRFGWDWLAFTAATIAVPTLWLARLAPLVAVPRLLLEDLQRARTPAPSAEAVQQKPRPMPVAPVGGR